MTRSTILRPLAMASLCLIVLNADAQNVGINATGAAPAASAILDLTSTNTGLLVPRIALTATNVAAPVVAPAVSLLVYNTATAGVAPNNVTPGYYYWDGAAWVRIQSGAVGWTILGNAGTNPATNFIGTTDANAWVIKTGGAAAANERARVLAGGQVVVNNIGLGANTNDVFSVYGTGTTNGVSLNTSALGLRAINGYTSAGGAAAAWGVLGSASGATGNSFGVVGLSTSTTGTANAIRGEAASISGPAVIGISNTSGGAVPNATATIAISGQVNGTIPAGGTGVAIGTRGIINPTIATGDARGVYGLSSSILGTGVWGHANTVSVAGFPIGTVGQVASEAGFGVWGVNTSVGVALNPVGVAGQVTNPIGFGVDGYNLSAVGTGVLGEGNNILGTYLGTGGGGAFSGTTNGSLSWAFTAASGTGAIGVGNNAGANVLAGGSGGAFTGTTAGAYGRATTVASGTGVVGAGNNVAPNTLATGSGGAFTGTTAGAYGLATTVASGTGVIGVGNNAGANTLAGGSGGAFTGATAGSYGRATTVASGTGVIGAGNNVAPTTLATGSGGAFTGTETGAFAMATTVATGTGLIAAGNNSAAAVLASGSGVAGTGDLFGVYGFATSNADAIGTPARAGGYFDSGTGVTNAYTYVAAFESGLPRKVMGNGTMNTVVKDVRDEYVLLSAPEAPENLFQDYGVGQLIDGRTHVQLDPSFSKNILVNEQHPLRVFVQLRGDCKGVFVTNEDANGFDVIELQGGNSNVSFYWTVTGNRADVTLSDGTVLPFAQERFGRTMGPQPRGEAENHQLAQPPSVTIESVPQSTVTPEVLQNKGHRPVVPDHAATDIPATPSEGSGRPQ